MSWPVNAPELGSDGEMRWERVAPPLWWPAAGCFIVADRHLGDGRRQHMVPGHVPAGLVVANADVIGEADVPQAEFAAHLSHLSEPCGACRPSASKVAGALRASRKAGAAANRGAPK